MVVRNPGSGQAALRGRTHAAHWGGHGRPSDGHAARCVEGKAPKEMRPLAHTPSGFYTPCRNLPHPLLRGASPIAEQEASGASIHLREPHRFMDVCKDSSPPLFLASRAWQPCGDSSGREWEGFMRTASAGREITHDVAYDFSSSFLGIPGGGVGLLPREDILEGGVEGGLATRRWRA